MNFADDVIALHGGGITAAFLLGLAVVVAFVIVVWMVMDK